jgi:hypothetical protein
MTQYNLIRQLKGTPTAWLGLNFRKVLSPIDGSLNQYMTVKCFHIIQDKFTGKYELTVSNSVAYDGEFEYPSHNEEGEPYMDTIFFGGIEPIAKCRDYWRFSLRKGYKPHNSLNIDLPDFPTRTHSLQGAP